DPAPLPLATNPDILTELVARYGSRTVTVGFAAETGDQHGTVADYGRAKLARKGCDVLVVNDVSGGAVFGAPDNAATVRGSDGTAIEVARGDKAELGAVICDVVAGRLDGR